MIINEILNYTFWGNTLGDYLIALGIFLGGVLIIFIFKQIIVHRMNKRDQSGNNNTNDLLNTLSRSLIPVLYLATLYLAGTSLTLTPTAFQLLQKGVIIVITIIVVKSVITVIKMGLHSYIRRSSLAEQREKQLKGIQTLMNLIIWIIALIFVLDNLGVKISAVVAGLGIGGIAVALAAQAILGDLFSYFVIFFDKPFEIGDFIITGDKMGSVEYIGMKTTRIRAIGGEQLVFSNTDLTNSRVHNYKKMERRRVVFKLSVVYQTPVEKLKKITQLVEEIIRKQDDTTFDRGHFAAYGEFSLNFEFVYYITGADYLKYMNIQEAINLSIYEAFEAEGISFAYPTQTVYIEDKK